MRLKQAMVYIDNVGKMKSSHGFFVVRANLIMMFNKFFEN